MEIGIIVYSNDPETVWNTFRFGNLCLKNGDKVKSFLLGKGVESESLNTSRCNVREQIATFVDTGGKIYACGTCLKIHQSEGSELCPPSTMRELYEIVKNSDKVVTF